MLPPLTEREICLYDRHYSLLQEWNERTNLVSRASIQDAFSIHYVDSLWVSQTVRKYLSETLDLFDIGSGAGFPGIIAAIHLDNVNCHLFERSQKKLAFLSHSVVNLDLKNVSIQGEFLKKPKQRGVFTARAVAPREEIIKLVSTVASKGSFFLSQVGVQGEQANPLRAGKLPIQWIETVDYELPQNRGPRRIHVYCFT